MSDTSDVVSTLRAAGSVFAEDEARLLIAAARTPAELTAMVDRRATGDPIEHIVGWAEFCGLRIAVGPGVFVPRRRTELLVRQAAALAPPRPVVVDLCCGSGAVGAALASTLGEVELYVADVDADAIRWARRNLSGVGAQVFQGDLYAALPATLRGRVDVLVANVPYVPTEEIALMPPEARTHEPLVSLDGGADGLDVLRRVAASAAQWLAPRGQLLVETSERQAPTAVQTFVDSGLVGSVCGPDELGGTVVIGMRSPMVGAA